MSAVADGHIHDLQPRAPRFGRLLRATLVAQIATTAAVWVAGLAVAIPGLGPADGADPYLPWAVDSIWSAVATAAYVGLLCALGGRIVADRLWSRGLPRPAAPYTWLAFGAAGYGARWIGHTTGARVLLAVVLAPLLLRLIAFRIDGAPRRRPVSATLSVRRRLVLLGAALAVLLSFSAAHAFTADGSGGGPGTGGVQRVAPGRPIRFQIGLSHLLLGTRIQGVTLAGSGARGVALVGDPQLSFDEPLFGPARGTALPARVPSGRSPWLDVAVALTRCTATPVRVDAVTLRYRVLGISTHERLTLQEPVVLACR